MGSLTVSDCHHDIRYTHSEHCVIKSILQDLDSRYCVCICVSVCMMCHTHPVDHQDDSRGVDDDDGVSLQMTGDITGCQWERGSW